jgi:porphobilinogen synthase
MLFGIPAVKDAHGSAADDPDGIVQRALADLPPRWAATVLMADLCLCEYTDHGHAAAPPGLRGGQRRHPGAVRVDRGRAGGSRGARGRPSGMMDGQVGVIRQALDRAGYPEVVICAYSAKYASAFYGPFRDAAECAPRFGDRSAYQQDPAAGDAVREILLDVDEGADIVMVKPALPYLDVIAQAAAAAPVPVAGYQVSGEYAMVEAAAANGWLDRDRVIMETLTAIRRAGASIILTYWAAEAARRLG